MKTQSSNRILAALLGAVAIVSLPVASRAVTNSVWNVAAGGAWSTNGNWTAGVPASPGDTASLTKDLAAAVIITNDISRSVGVLNLGDSTTAFFPYTLTNAAGATFAFNNIGNGASLVQTLTTATDLISSPIVLSDNLNITNSSGLTISGIVSAGSSAYNLSKAGAGTLALNGVNTYGGITAINAGAITIGADTGLGAAPGSAVTNQLTLNGGTLAVSVAGQTLAAARGVTLGSSGGTVDVSALNTAASTTISGIIGGTGALTLKSSGDISPGGGGAAGLGIKLANTNTFIGNVTITSGLVSYVGDGSFGNAANTIILNGGGLLESANPGVLMAHNIQVNAGGGTFRFYGSSAPIWTGSITGSGKINKTDGGSLTLAGDLSGFSGNFTNCSTGNLILSNSVASSIGGNWTITNTVTINSSVAKSLAGNIAGPGVLTKAGTGALTPSGVNTYTGGTALNGGILVVSSIADAGGAGSIGTYTSAGSGYLGIANDSTFRYTGTGSETTTRYLWMDTGAQTRTIDVTSATGSIIFNGMGGGNLIKPFIKAGLGSLQFNHPIGSGANVTVNAGSLTLTGTNSYTDFTTINAGTFTLAGAAQLGSGTYAGLITNNGAFVYNSSAAQTLSGVVSGTGALTVSGTGRLTLPAVNPLSGAVAVNAGELLGVTGGSLAGAVTVASGATNGVQVISSGGQWACPSLTYNAGNAYVEFNFFAAVPSTTTAPLQVNGNLTLNGTLNIIIRGGGFAVGTYPLIKYTGSLSGTPPATALTLPNGMTATINNNTGNSSLDLVVTVGNQITWATGSGTWDINTTQNWQDTSSTPVNYLEPVIPGNAVLFEDTLSGASPITVALNTIVSPAFVTANDSTKDYIISGTGGISGSGSLAKSGNGTLTLSTANSYSGMTTISTGSLVLSNAAALGSSSLVTVGSGGTLDLAGFSSARPVTFAGTGVSGAALTNSSTVAQSSLSGTVNLSGDAAIGSATNISGQGISATINLAGYTLTLNPGRWVTANLSSGNITLNNGAFLQLGSGADSTGVITNNAGAIIDVRDYNNTAQANAHTIYLNGGTVGNGDPLGSGGNGNGGGSSGQTLKNPIVVGPAGGTLSGNNYVFGGNSSMNLAFSGAMSGSGVLNIKGGKGITLSGDPSAFTGTASNTTALLFAGVTNQTFNGILAGSGSVTTANSTILTLSATNTYTGDTTVSAGALVGVSGGSCSNSSVTIGTGSTNGVLLTAANGQWACGNLFLGALPTDYTFGDFNFGSFAVGSTAPLMVNGNVTIAGRYGIIVRNTTLAVGQYPLIKYSGTLTGGLPYFPLSVPGTVLAYITNNVGNKSVDLVVTATSYSSDIWAKGNGVWDINTTLNWTNASGTPITYQEGSAVVFNTPPSNSVVTLNTTVNPAALANGIALNNTAIYTVAGSGSIAGVAGLTKSGSSELILATANTYSGGTTLNAGTVRASGTDAALGTGPVTVAGSATLATASGGFARTLSNPITVNSGQTLSVDGGYYPVTLTGPIVDAGTLQATSSGVVTVTNAINGNGNIQVNGSGTFNVNGPLSGSAALTVPNASGTLAFGGTSTGFTGPVNLNGGAAGLLLVASGANLTTTNVLNENWAKPITVNGTLSVGAASVSINSTMALSGSGVFNCSSFTIANGTTVVNDSLTGTFTDSGLFSDGTATTSTFNQLFGTVTLSTATAGNIQIGTTTNTTGNYTLSGGVLNALNSDTVIAYTGAGNVTVSAGTASLKGVKFGSGVSSATGTLTLSGGTLKIGADGISNGSTGVHTMTINLGSGTLGTVTGSGGWSSALPMTLTAATTPSFDTTGGNISLTGILSGGGSLTKAGANTLTLNAAESYTGATAVKAGTLALGASGTLATTPVISLVSGGVFDISAAGFTLGSAQVLTGGRTASPATDINGNLTSSGTINIAGTGTNGTLTINGNLSLTGGNLAYDLGASSDQIALSGTAALSLTGTTTIQPVSGLVDGTYTLINNIASVTAGAPANLALAGGAPRGATAVFAVAAPAVTLTVSGTAPSSLVWRGTNGPNWDVSTINWDNSSVADRFYSMDNVSFDDSGLAPVSLVGTLYPSTVAVNGSSINNVFGGSGSIAGAATLSMNGGSTLTISNANSFTGGTTINAGTVKVANSSALGVGPLSMTGGVLDLNSNNLSVGTLSGNAGTIKDNYVAGGVAVTRTLTVNQVVSNTFAGVINNGSSNTVALVKNGPGYLKLTGADTFTGLSTVNGGTLELTAKSGDVAYVVTNGATLKIGYSTGGGYANTAMTIYGDGTSATTGFYLAGGKNYNVSGAVVVNNAPTTIRQYGSGLANIGIFDFNSNPGLSITAAASGSVIDANIQMVNLGYGMVLTTAPGVNNATGDLIINGPLGVTGSGFFKRGTGSVLLNGVAASANGGLQLQAGTVICGVNNCIGTNASLPISSGATLIMNGYSQSVPNVTGAGVIVGGSAAQSTLTINTATTNTFTGAVGGIGLNQNNLALVKLGAGQQILSGTLTYKGSTTVGAGSLVMSSLPVADGATLSVPDVAWSLTGTSLALGTSAGCTLAITGFASASSAPIVVTNLATAGTVTVTLNGTLALGEYPLIKYSGTIGGAGINAFQLLRGMSGYITNRTDLSQVDVVLSGTAIYPLAWKGNVNTNWDINTTTNWAFNILPSAFMNSDTVQFDDTAVVASTNVVLNVTVSPSALTVTNNSLSYTLSGNGALAGTMGLTKFGSNTMTLLTTNTYTGVTTISGGTVSIPSLNNGGLASPLGAATNSPTSIVLDGGTLAFTSPATNASNRGFTLTTNNGTIAVTDPSGIQVFNGAANSVTGAGSLTKTGNGTLTLSSLNNYSGTTVVNGGKLVSTVWEWYGRRGIGSGLLTINSGATAEFTQVHGFGVDIGGRTAVLNGGHLQLDSGNYVAGFTMTGGLVDSGTNIVTLTVSGTGMNVTANAAATTAVVSNGISAGTYSGAVGLTLVASNGAAPIGLEMDGNLADGGIALNLTKNGAGTVLLTGTNTYTGNTTINGGTLILSNESFSAGSPIISLANGANLNISGLVNPFVLGGGQTLKGSGTLVGAVSDTPGTTFTPGGITNVGTLHFSSDLTLAGNETLNFDLGKTPTSAGGTNSDQLTVVGNLTINSGTTVNVNPIQLALAGGRYTLIAYSGTLINPGSTAGWALNDPGVVAGRVTGAYIDESIAGEIDLVVSGSPATLVWQGDGAMNAWDVQTTFNWLNGGSPDQYYQLDNVLFDDTGSASPFVDLQSYSPITPSSMVVSNNTKHYIINSTYGQGIDGGGTLTKNGTGTLTFLNSNPYTGLTTINAGTLELGDGATADGAITASPILDNATLEFDVVSAQNALTPISGSGIVAKDGPGVLYLGSGANAWTGGLTIANGTVMPSVNNALPGGESVTVTAGGAYDFNGINNGGSTTRAYSFTIAGNGTGGGALVNNGASVVSYASVSNLTLSADATLGGGGRWDIGPVTNSTMNGNHHILTSMGSQIDFRAQVMTNLENIQITAGNVWYEGYSQTNPWTATMTNYLASGAVLGIYGSQIINAPIVSSGGTINNKGSGTPVWSGFVDAEQPTTLSSAGGSLVFAGTLTTNLYGSTSGSFTVSGNNTISFAGTVKVPLVDMSWTAGTVQLGYNSPSGSIPDSAVTVPAGATFSVYRSDLYTLTNVITGDGSMSILGSNGIVVNAANITIGGTLSVGQGAYGKMLVQPGANITANGLFLGNPGGVGGDVVQSGGILTTTNAGSFFRIGHWGTESSSYTMSGGILNVGGALSVGWDGNGTLTQSGGFIQTTKLTVDDSGNGPLGIYTLTGGTNLIGVGGITSAGTYLVNLGGGTIAASTNWSSSLNLSLTGTNGSTVFDTGIYTNTFSGAFAGAGGLVKNGSGSLVLSSAGAYTYTNDTFVNAGTLTLSGTAVAGGVNKLSSGTVWVSPGAALNLAAAGQFNYASGTPLVVLNAGTLAMTDGQYNYIKNLTMTNGATWALGTGQLVNGLTGANFNLTNVTSLASANTSVITSRGGAIAAASGVTFNVARGTAASDLTVSAALTDYNGTPGAVTKTGNGILTLNTADTYTGTTTVSAGTLALGTFGSLGNTTNIVIAGSALLDVSAASLALGSSQTLGNGTGTGLVAGNVSVNSGKLALAFAGAASVPSLQVTNGNLTLSPSSAIKVNNTGSALPAGSYKLISKATGGAVAGTVPASVTVSGGGLASGMTASLQITSGELYLVVVSPVNTTPAPIVSTTSGSTLTLTWPTDHQGWRLQVQTNNLTTGISTNWYDWPGSTNTTSVNISMDPNAPTVFFRMIYP